MEHERSLKEILEWAGGMIRAKNQPVMDVVPPDALESLMHPIAPRSAEHSDAGCIGIKMGGDEVA